MGYPEKGTYEDLPNAGNLKIKRPPEMAQLLDKNIYIYLSELSKWSGSDHYRGAMIERVDMIHASGDAPIVFTHIVSKYMDRIRQKYKNGKRDIEDHQKDLVKAGHYLGLLFDSLLKSDGHSSD